MAPRSTSLDPFDQVLDFVRAQRLQYAQDAALGKWMGEPAARELVGRVKQCDAIESEMRKITGPQSPFGERDL